MQVTAQCSPITAVDKMASNGVIHVLGRVMHPPRENTIVGAAIKCPVFKTLVKAVTAAGLVETLSGKLNYTVCNKFVKMK